MRKKILVTVSSLHMGGIQKALLNFLNTIDNSKYQIDLVLWTYSKEWDDKVPSNINVLYINKEHPWFDNKNVILKLFHGIIRSILRKINYAWYLKKAFTIQLNDTQYDAAIAFCGSCINADYYVAMSKSIKKYIFVHTNYIENMKYEHDFVTRFKNSKEKYKYFDKIVCVSESAKKAFDKLMPMHSNKTIVINNIIELDKNNNNQDQIILNEKEFNIISVGRLTKIKGFERLVEIQKKLTDNNINAKTYLMGDGEEKEELNSLIKKYDLEKSFNMLGKISNPFNKIKNANLYVMTSYNEGFPTVLMESLASNIPVVSPQISGAEDIYKHVAPKGSMILCENNVDALYSGVIRAINGEINNKFNFDLDLYNQKIKQKYMDLMDGKYDKD